jgi:hypothetical protein
MRRFSSLAALLLAPALVVAQQTQRQSSIDRLQQVLPAEVAERVVGIVNDAISKGLPGLAIAERALEGVAKGRSGAEVSAAAQAFAADLAAARGALQGAGRTPDASEIEAGATAMDLGVDGATVSTLASSAPSGRSLAVPLAVIGALVNRGLSSDAALQAIQQRLSAGVGNTEFVEMPGEAGRLIAEGYTPAEVGRMLAAGAGIPAGVPANAGAPGQRPQPVRPPRP